MSGALATNCFFFAEKARFRLFIGGGITQINLNTIIRLLRILHLVFRELSLSSFLFLQSRSWTVRP